MPRVLIPDDQGGEAVTQYMLNLMASMRKLHDTSKDAILRQQVRNMRKYNNRKAVGAPGNLIQLKVGDMVWVRDANLRKNKLKQQFFGPYYVNKLIGDLGLAVELSINGKDFITRSIDHVCLYHKLHRKQLSENEVDAAPECLMDEG